MCLIWLMFGILFLHLSTSLGCLCPQTFFLNSGLDKYIPIYRQWAFFISDLYTKIRLISRSVSGFATGSSCGIWDRGWNTCRLYDGPLLGLCVLKWHFMCKFGMVVRNLLSIFFALGSCFCTLHKFFLLFLVSFLFWNTFFYIKYVVLPYSIDMASALFS